MGKATSNGKGNLSEPWAGYWYTYPQTHGASLSVANDPLPGPSITNVKPTQAARPVVPRDLPHEIFRLDGGDLGEFIQENKGMTSDLKSQNFYMINKWKCISNYLNKYKNIDQYLAAGEGNESFAQTFPGT